jgi:hypothetical protein
MDILNVIEHMNEVEINEFVNYGSNTEATETSTITTDTSTITTDTSTITTDIYTQKIDISTTINEMHENIIENNTECNHEENKQEDDIRVEYYENDEEYYEEDDNQIYYEDDYKQVCLFYEEDTEIYSEELMDSYHSKKNFGNWHYAKRIISHSYENKQATEFFWDYLERQFKENSDNFSNIFKVYYKNDLDIDIIYEFDSDVARYVVDNLKIQEYKPKGYIFSGDENQNKWEFKIIVITTKGIYSANRYITDSIIGCY